MYSEQMASIAALDLTPVKAKLMHGESGEGWSLAYAEKMEREYRRFLHLVKQFPDEHVVPLFDVDVFWHYHILHTMKYAADCDLVFGYFLHHDPYSAFESEADESRHHAAGLRLQALYQACFGETDMADEDVVTPAPGSRSIAAKSALSSPAARKTAWSSPAARKTAWSSPVARKSAWSSPVVRRDVGASAATPTSAQRTVAMNDHSSVRPLMAEPA